jgi:hypothetical protein
MRIQRNAGRLVQSPEDALETRSPNLPAVGVPPGKTAREDHRARVPPHPSSLLKESQVQEYDGPVSIQARAHETMCERPHYARRVRPTRPQQLTKRRRNGAKICSLDGLS